MSLATCCSIVVGALFLLSACSDAPPALSDHDLARHNQAVGLMGQYRYDAALEHLERLVVVHPGNQELKIDLAIATLNRQQDGDEFRALSMLEEVMKQHPGHLRAYYCAGLLELNQGNIEQAAGYFNRVAEADPDDAYAAYYLGLTLGQQGQVEEALGWYQRAIGKQPYLRSAYYGAFQVLRQLKRRDEAKQMLVRYQKLEKNPRALLAEFKYTRMGPKAELVPIGLQAGEQLPARPEGELFSKRQNLYKSSFAQDRDTGFSLTTADINADGIQDVFLAGASRLAAVPNAVLLGDKDGKLVPAEGHPLASVDRINAVLWGDIDNDGLIDAYLCRRGENQLWRQTGAGQWENVTNAITANGTANTVDGALFDADHDGDLDIFLVNEDQPNELLNNNRDGSFRVLAAELGIAGDAARRSRAVSVVDIDRDRDADLLVLNSLPPHEVYLNDLLWEYRPAEGFDLLRNAQLGALLPGDLDADGQLELYTLDPVGRITRWQPDGAGEWSPVHLAENTAADLVGKSEGIPPELSLIDIDGDGDRELIRSGKTGWTVLGISGNQLSSLAGNGYPVAAWVPLLQDALKGPALLDLDNRGALSIHRPGNGRHPFLALELTGLEDQAESLRSNTSGIGTRVALRNGRRWTVMENYDRHTGPGQSLQPLAVGLGGSVQLDYVNIEWTDGVFQSELNLAMGERHRISETQRQLSSCPVLFAWDGADYRFVSDLLGVGGIGFALGKGEYAESRPWENFLLPSGSLRAKDGRYRLKLTEPMEEAAYLDAARLVAYDLPPGWRMTLDERMGILGPEPTGRPVFYREELLPVSVVNERDQDVTEAVIDADLHAAPVGELDRRFIGRLAGEHVVTLEFHRALDDAAGQPVLLVDGWVEYPYSQTMFAAWQAGAVFEAPTLEAMDAAGNWQTIMQQFGYPAGMPRQMSVMLNDLPPGSRHLRLRTNQEIYWDRIAVVYQEQPSKVRSTLLSLEAARVETVGFPLRTTGEQRLPHYDWKQRLPFWDTRHMAGYYTEFGAVEALVGQVDDAVAIIGPGEGIHLEFADELPPLASGWTREMVLETNGWAKDMDLFTRDGETLGPLPQRQATTPDRDQLHAKHNTRYRSG